MSRGFEANKEMCACLQRDEGDCERCPRLGTRHPWRGRRRCGYKRGRGGTLNKKMRVGERRSFLLLVQRNCLGPQQSAIKSIRLYCFVFLFFHFSLFLLFERFGGIVGITFTDLHYTLFCILFFFVRIRNRTYQKPTQKGMGEKEQS